MWHVSIFTCIIKPGSHSFVAISYQNIYFDPHDDADDCAPLTNPRDRAKIERERARDVPTNAPIYEKVIDPPPATGV